MWLINSSKKGESIDCMERVISRSIGKEGVVSTRKVNMAKAPIARNNATRNNTVRYHRVGGDVIVIFVIVKIPATQKQPALPHRLLLHVQSKGFHEGQAY